MSLDKLRLLGSQDIQYLIIILLIGFLIVFNYVLYLRGEERAGRSDLLINNTKTVLSNQEDIQNLIKNQTRILQILEHLNQSGAQSDERILRMLQKLESAQTQSIQQVQTYLPEPSGSIASVDP